jgi:hypothetical protein
MSSVSITVHDKHMTLNMVKINERKLCTTNRTETETDLNNCRLTLSASSSTFTYCLDSIFSIKQSRTVNKLKSEMK